MAVAGKWTHEQAAKAVRTGLGKRGGKRRNQRVRASDQVKQTFFTEGGWRIVATHMGKAMYHDLKEAMTDVMEEIDLRINNNVQLY